MKLKTLLAASCSAIALTVSLASCGDSTDENYTFGFAKGSTTMLTTYADQTTDSTFIRSTNNWTLNKPQSEWLSASYNGQPAPLSVSHNSFYGQDFRINYLFSANTTGEERTATITFTCNAGKLDGTTLGTIVVQKPYLNILQPAAEADQQTKKVSFTLNVPSKGQTASGTKPQVMFLVYADGATLTSSDESWLKVESGNQTTAGVYAKNAQQTVNLAISENTLPEPREATLTLTSNGVSTPITIHQDAHSEKGN